MTAARTGKRDGVAYVVPRFPKVSETFILHEVLELERAGTPVVLMAIVRERPRAMHPEAAARLEGVRFASQERGGVLASQLHWLARRPLAYLGLWLRALAGNARSPKFLARALLAVPAGAHFGRLAARTGVGRIHAHYATHSALAALVAARLARLPFSFTAHAHDIYVDTTMLRAKLRAADLVVTISDYNRRLLERLCPSAAGRIEVVRTGADLDTFAPVPEPDGDGAFTIGCVASLEPYKGIGHLVDAVALLRDEGVDVCCEVAGEGEERARLEERIASHGLNGRFALLGAQPKPAVRALMQRSHVFALPSVVTETGKREGIPVALMEALACGRAVVASDISGIPELVQDGATGLLVPERDPASLAAAIRRLHDDPLLRGRVAAAGRERVLAEYDLRANARRLAKLLAA